MLLKNGKLVDEEIIDETPDMLDEVQSNPSETSKINQLAAGLSTAKTIAEIRTAAKQILDETDGGESDE